MTLKKRMVGLVGCGYWGKNILRNLYDMGVLHTACDSDRAIIAAHKERFPDIDYVTDVAKVLENTDIEAVAIATPAATHYELIRKALSAGKDVFVEKPLALTVKEGEELARLAEEKKAVLMVGHILQYHPAVKRLKELIRSGEIGKVQYIYSNRLNIGKLRTEENILWSFAPHDISVILSLMGREPVKVQAFGGEYLNKGIYDVTMTSLDFGNDVKGHIFVSWLHPYKEQKLIVVGSKAMVVFDDVSKEKLFLYPHKIEWRDGKVPVAQKADHQVVSFESGEPLRMELEHFVDCVRTREIPLTDKYEGLRVLKVLEEAERSMFSGESSRNNSSGSDEKPYSVHESAYVDQDVSIGKGTKIWHFSHVLKESRIGEDVIIGQNVSIGPRAVIGDRCKVQNGVSIYDGVELEEEVFCGPAMTFTNVYNPRAFIERKDEFRKTLVRKGATIGANATVVCGNELGRYSFIAAGAVVNADVPPYAVYAGVPAKRIGWVCKCAVSLKEFDAEAVAVCPRCGNKYKEEERQLKVLEEK